MPWTLQILPGLVLGKAPAPLVLSKELPFSRGGARDNELFFRNGLFLLILELITWLTS